MPRDPHFGGCGINLEPCLFGQQSISAFYASLSVLLSSIANLQKYNYQVQVFDVSKSICYFIDRRCQTLFVVGGGPGGAVARCRCRYRARSHYSTHYQYRTTS